MQVARESLTPYTAVDNQADNSLIEIKFWGPLLPETSVVAPLLSHATVGDSDRRL